MGKVLPENKKHFKFIFLVSHRPKNHEDFCGYLSLALNLSSEVTNMTLEEERGNPH